MFLEQMTELYKNVTKYHNKDEKDYEKNKTLNRISTSTLIWDEKQSIL